MFGLFCADIPSPRTFPPGRGPLCLGIPLLGAEGQRSGKRFGLQIKKAGRKMFWEITLAAVSMYEWIKD